ncbi:glycosyltransferase family 87 protein [Sphingomonas qomolangmaensis]|uniref:DUF2029 domain-containing protein n=1 Tax=Sphingomonas qomolangmaensis TaxID=2918765 RepID=A0ABY5LFB4_9SPHN|nr:glycosyltransferase family 87 protein [Sphingomonas qomolangmaensis]UUL83401.1 DUF2029 domain-containing protein [Sphingomonas qomolangmaensis]
MAIVFGVVALWFAAGGNGEDAAGRAIGTDFVSFWIASQVALAEGGAAAYDIVAHGIAQRTAFGPGDGYVAFFYPPVFLMLCLPMALLPYFAALGLWLGSTALAYLVMVRHWLGGSFGSAALTLAAFPPTLLNAGHGQNAFLTAALFGGGLIAMRTRPWLAGLLLGLLVMKPHLAILLPLALACRGEWRTFIATGAAAAGWCLLSWAILGTGAWAGFIANTGLARSTLEDGLVAPAKMVSMFAAMRVLSLDVATAYAAQAAFAAVGAAAVIYAARARLPRPAQDAILAAATLTVSPFLLDYDLTLMAIPLAWWFAQTQRRGFLPYEKAALLALFIAPLFLRTLATAASLPLAPLVTAGLLLGCWRAALTASPSRHSRAASAR